MNGQIGSHETVTDYSTITVEQYSTVQYNNCRAVEYNKVQSQQSSTVKCNNSVFQAAQQQSTGQYNTIVFNVVQQQSRVVECRAGQIGLFAVQCPMSIDTASKCGDHRYCPYSMSTQYRGIVQVRPYQILN